MKRNISICIFFAVFIVFAAVCAGRFFRYDKPDPVPYKEETTQSVTETEELIASTKTEEAYRYIILEDNGRLSVYLSDNETLYMDTGIPKDALSEDMKKELASGIRFSTEEALFDFLESCSS